MKAYDIMKCRHTRHYRLHLTSKITLSNERHGAILLQPIGEPGR